VPLTAYQADLARLLSKQRTPDSYLAGGAALHIEPNTRRFSNDLDYFNDSFERVARAFEDDRKALVASGYEVEVEVSQPGFVRALVKRDKQATKIDWAHDTAWRFLPTVMHEVSGYQLHPIDLAINKLLALVGRNEPRDFLDVIDVHDKTLPLGALCWAGAGKDPGYTPLSLLDLARRRGSYRAEDFARLHLASPVDLPDLKRRWQAALDHAAAFIAARPPSEVGCLYYSKRERRFVAPEPGEATDAVPHYGRPGGILPTPVPSE
jgi:hypothetical protein